MVRLNKTNNKLNLLFCLDDALLSIEEKVSSLNNFEEFSKKMSRLNVCKRIFSLAHEKLRQDYIQNKKEQAKKSKKRRIDLPKEIVCNEKWPVCQVQMELIKSKDETDFFIFKQGPALNILKHDDYFEEPSTEDLDFILKKKKSIPFISMVDNLVIGRYEHMCKEIKENEDKVLKNPIQIQNKISDFSLRISSNETEITVENNPILFQEIRNSNIKNIEQEETTNELKPLKRKKAEIFKREEPKEIKRKKANSWHLFCTTNEVIEISFNQGKRRESASACLLSNRGDKDKIKKTQINFDLFPRLNKAKMENIGRVACSPSFIFIKSLNIGRDEQVFFNSFQK